MAEILLDRNLLWNYCLVSNLVTTTGNLVEKVAVKWLVDHLHSHELEEQLQSAYKAGHSTENALLKVHDHVSRALGHGMGILMLYLDYMQNFICSTYRPFATYFGD